MQFCMCLSKWCCRTPAETFAQVLWGETINHCQTLYCLSFSVLSNLLKIVLQCNAISIYAINISQQAYVQRINNSVFKYFQMAVSDLLSDVRICLLFHVRKLNIFWFWTVYIQYIYLDIISKPFTVYTVIASDCYVSTTVTYKFQAIYLLLAEYKFSHLQQISKKPALGWLLSTASCYLLKNRQTNITMLAARKSPFQSPQLQSSENASDTKCGV